jgi:cation diffusion facilitator family transporter
LDLKRKSEAVRYVRHARPDLYQTGLYRRAILIAVAGNVLLAASKGLVAWTSGSSAVLADASNSLSDVIYSGFMAFGLWLSQRPADASHPQGHGRFEPLVSLVIGAMMGLAGYAAIAESIARFRSGAVAIEPGWPTVALLGSGLVKIQMYRLVNRLGRQAHSPAIQASARDNLSDVFTSAAAWLGVLGSSYVSPWLDPAAGVAVSLWIFRMAAEIWMENLGYLTGREALPEVVERIEAAALAVPGVLGVNQVIADHVGPRVRVDMHIDVDGELTLNAAHAIADQVQAQVEALPQVDLAHIHAEPVAVQVESRG